MKLKTFFLCCIFVGASTVSGQVDDFVTGCLATDVKLPCAQDYNINNIGGSVTRILWNIEKSPSELILQYTISSSTLQYAASYAGTTKYEFDAADYSLVLKNTASNDSDFLYTCSTLGSHSYVVNITLETCTTTATPVAVTSSFSTAQSTADSTQSTADSAQSTVDVSTAADFATTSAPSNSTNVSSTNALVFISIPLVIVVIIAIVVITIALCNQTNPSKKDSDPRMYRQNAFDQYDYMNGAPIMYNAGERMGQGYGGYVGAAYPYGYKVYNPNTMPIQDLYSGYGLQTVQGRWW